MAIYAIGDIQGCYDHLRNLLDKIQFDQKKDKLWIAGDLVNRGPDSLKTLRFIKSLGSKTKIVLGNHDLSLLALSEGYGSMKKHTLDDILKAPDRDELLYWLRQQKLLHYSKKRKFAMVHAGIYPHWSIPQALKYAAEVEAVLQSEQYTKFLKEMFGNHPSQWHKQLNQWDRLRFITNSMTRMRYLNNKYQLNFKEKGAINTQSDHLTPWFDMPRRKTKKDHIIFGHWSTLFGKTNTNKTHALDTGCLWGGYLTAMKLPKNNKQGKIKLIQLHCK